MKNEDLSTNEIILSIIIPTYNRNEYIVKLLDKLHNQMKDNVEVIVVDDHSDIPLEKSWFKYIYLDENSGGASVPRNVGLDNAKGKYICFVDADDMVSDDYIETILEKTKEDWDFCYISWQGKSIKVIIRDTAPTWNCCVWNAVYKRDLIGNKRFDPKLKMAEDYDFNRKVRNGKKANITKILYYYNEDTPNSLTKQGEMYNSKY